jgi:hypothetical protein
MRILVGFVFMGMIALVAVVLAAVQLLIKLLPLLVIALLAVGAVRLWEHRRAPGVGRPAAPQPPVIRRPAPQSPPLRPRRAGRWVMVPVWMDAGGPRQRHPVIDAEVIGEDGEHRG